MVRRETFSMRHLRSSIIAKALLIAPLVLPFIKASAQSKADPHRPPCTDAHCQKIKSFLRAHYCSDSPYGNGPDDGCAIEPPKHQSGKIEISADFKCTWKEDGLSCEQHGQASPEIRSILLQQLNALGLPANKQENVHFLVWKWTGSAGWTIANAEYLQISGTDLMLCQVIVAIDHNQVRFCAKCHSKKPTRTFQL